MAENADDIPDFGTDTATDRFAHLYNRIAHERLIGRLSPDFEAVSERSKT